MKIYIHDFIKFEEWLHCKLTPFLYFLYRWCTPEDVCGLIIQKQQEMMERQGQEIKEFRYRVNINVC